MKILLVLAHDKKESLNYFIFNKVLEFLKDKNVEIDILNLYDYKTQIPFYVHDKDYLENNIFFQDNKRRFLNADRLILIHPIYWYSIPGILKCWIDLITNYAYKYESGLYAKALHKIKKTLTINTSMEALWSRKFFQGNTATKQVKSTFKFLGIKNNYFHEIGAVYSLTPEKLEKHFKKIFKKIEKKILS